ncbi:hypothetical protein ACOMHN_010315 [Nucella lapillus]
MEEAPVVEAGLFSVGQASFPGDQLEQFMAYRVGWVLNMVTPPVLFSLGVPGNLMTLLVLTRSAFRSNACCMYLAALALCDTLVLLLYFLFSFVDNFLYKLLSNDLTCKLYYFLFFTCVHLSAWLLVAVTMQRCFVVCRPMTSRIVTSKRCTVCVIGGLTAASVTLNFYQLVIREVVWNTDSNNPVCHVRGKAEEMFVLKVWPWIDAAAYCFVPSLCLFILNLLIIHALRKAAAFRKTFQPHHQKRQTIKCIPSTKDRVKVEEDKNLFNSLFVCKAGEATSRTAPRADDPVLPAWNNDSSVLESETEDSSHRDFKHQQVQNNPKQTLPSTNCSPMTLEASVEVSEGYVRNGCNVSQTTVSSQFSASESLEPEPDSESVEILSKGTLLNTQHVNQWPQSSGTNNTQGLSCNEQSKKSDRTQGQENSESAANSVVNNVSDNFPHKPEDRSSKVRDDADRTTKSENRNGTLSKKRNKCNIRDEMKPRETAVQTHTQTASEGVSEGSQRQVGESQRRQLTMMPLLASLVFLTLSAPLAVMLVAENTVWVRSTAEEVAVYTVVRMVTNTLMYLNHSVNFLLYCFAGSTFRRHCCSLLCRLCRCASAARPSSSSISSSCAGTKSSSSPATD